jgi:hypothetical protein
VDEGVIAAAIGCDEAVAFGFIEELYGSGSHLDFLLRRGRKSARFLLGAKREGKGAAKRPNTVSLRLVAAVCVGAFPNNCKSSWKIILALGKIISVW